MEFTHRASGAKATGLSLEDFETLPEASKRYVIEYGLRQCQADSYASAKNETEFHGLLNKRIDALKAGTISLRASGPRLDPFESECIAIARAKVKDALRAKGFTGKNAPPKEAVAKLVTDYRNGPAKEAIEREARRRVKATLDVEADLAGAIAALGMAQAGAVDEPEGEAEGDE